MICGLLWGLGNICMFFIVKFFGLVVGFLFL